MKNAHCQFDRRSQPNSFHHRRRHLYFQAASIEAFARGAPDAFVQPLEAVVEARSESAVTLSRLVRVRLPVAYPRVGAIRHGSWYPVWKHTSLRSSFYGIG